MAVADASGSPCGCWGGLAASNAAGRLGGAGATAGPAGSECEGIKTAGSADEKPQFGHTHSAFLSAPSTATFASSPMSPQNVLVMIGAGVTGSLRLSSTAGIPEKTKGSGRSAAATAAAGPVCGPVCGPVSGPVSAWLGCASVPEDMMFRM
jgi:hypothetical protein